MTRLQEETARKILECGCSSRFDTESGDLMISYNGQDLITLAQDDCLYTDLQAKINYDMEKYCEIKALIIKISEYVGLYERSPPMAIKDVANYHRFASYNGVVLAGMYDDKHGFMFTTWRETPDGSYVINGDYSRDFEYVKEAFSTRSNLIDKSRLMNNQELKILHYCLAYTCENEDNLSLEEERAIFELKERFKELLPAVSEEQEAAQSNQQNI